VHCTQHNEIGKFKNTFALDIYACIEMSKQSYFDIMMMPYKRFLDYLKWKSDLEEEKQKKFEEQSNSM